MANKNLLFVDWFQLFRFYHQKTGLSIHISVITVMRNETSLITLEHVITEVLFVLKRRLRKRGHTAQNLDPMKHPVS